MRPSWDTRMQHDYQKRMQRGPGICELHSEISLRTSPCSAYACWQADTAMREQQLQQGGKAQAPDPASKDGQEATASGGQSQEQRPALAAGAVAAGSTGQQVTG